MVPGTIIEGPVTKVNIGRLTNAIFVFTLLLLFKNVRLPSFTDALNSSPVDNFGYMQIPDILSFVNAFIIIAMFWVVTFHIFHQVQRLDRGYIYLHFGLLAMIIFIPITSHLYQIFDGNSILAMFFHFNVLIISIFLIAEWFHCKKRPAFFSPSCIQYRMGCITRKLLYIPITALIGIGLSIQDIPYSRNLYYVTMGVFFIDWILTRHKHHESGGNHD